MNKEEEKIQIFGAILLVILFIAGASIYTWYDDKKTSEVQTSEIDEYSFIEKSKINVRSRLKDPKSAEFKNVYFYNSNEIHPVACGMVNSKNSYGGYSGYQRFISVITNSTVIFEKDMSSAAEFEKTWQSLCF